MAKKLTDNDIALIRELYPKLKTYAAVARQTGFSPATVKKYVTGGDLVFVTPTFDVKKFDVMMTPLSEIKFPTTRSEWGAWCSLTKEEEGEIKEFSKGLIV